MRFSASFLALITILVTCCHVFATNEEFSQIKENSSRARLASNGKRLLQVSLDSHDNENRGMISSIQKWLQMRRWVNGGKSDDVVMHELGLTGLKGKALKTHPNYGRFQKFKDKAEQKYMQKLIDRGVSTELVWYKLNLERLSGNKRKNSKNFQFYVRYATKYDNEIFWNQNSYSRPVVYYGGSRREMFVKVGIWAKENRPRDYVKALLNLEYASERRLLANRYYQRFLYLTREKAS